MTAIAVAVMVYYIPGRILFIEVSFKCKHVHVCSLCSACVYFQQLMHVWSI